MAVLAQKLQVLEGRLPISDVVDFGPLVTILHAAALIPASYGLSNSRRNRARFGVVSLVPFGVLHSTQDMGDPDIYRLADVMVSLVASVAPCAPGVPNDRLHVPASGAAEAGETLLGHSEGIIAIETVELIGQHDCPPNQLDLPVHRCPTERSRDGLPRPQMDL
jgi:hypothetical protein